MGTINKQLKFLLALQLLILIIGFDLIFRIFHQKISFWDAADPILGYLFFIPWFLVAVGLSINQYLLAFWYKKTLFSRKSYYIWRFILFFEDLLWIFATFYTLIHGLNWPG